MSDAARELQRLDADARRAALDTARSILLQAPAGSGKTTVLVCRYLKLLAAVEQPEQILAITFTRKAAAEMRARVLHALQSAAAGKPDALTGAHALAALAHATERRWQLLDNPARLRITTIDAVCHALVTAHPVLSGGGAGANLAADASGLYQRAAEQCLNGAAADAALQPALRLWLQRLDNQWPRLVELLRDMLGQRSAWLPLVLDQPPAQLAAAVNAAAASLVEALLAAGIARLPAAILGAGSELARIAAAQVDTQTPATRAWLETEASIAAHCTDLPRWRWLAELLLSASSSGKGEWRKAFTRNQGIPKEQKQLKQRAESWVADMRSVPGALEFWREVAVLPPLPMPPEDAAALAALAQLLVRAVQELHAVFALQGQVDFSYIAGAARQTLVDSSEPTSVALSASAELRHLLVDEFQDTSRPQYELLKAMTLGWSPGDGRTLFMVGDPMQSIYLFRQAEVGNFLSVRERGLGALRLECLQLRVNFRSDRLLVDWVNRRFARLFPASDDLARSAICFLPAVAATADQLATDDPAAKLPVTVQVHPLNGHADMAAVAAAEAGQVVELVSAAWKDCPAASIAVLVANRRHASEISQALGAAGIAVRATKLTKLSARSTVRDLLSLARALQHAGDRVAWLALLRGPWCGLELAELEQLASASEDTVWSLLHDAARLGALPAEAARRALRLRAALAPAVEGHDCRLPLAQRLHHAWLRLGGAALCRQPRDLADARACLSALALRADLEQLSGADFDALLDELYAAADEQAQQVEILTMHGAKGLQWDVVIAPSLGRQRANDPQPLLCAFSAVRADGGADWLLAPLRDSADSSRDPSLARWLRRLSADRQQLERVRLLYVLATRARRALHLFGHTTLRKEGEHRPDSRSLLADAWAAVAADFVPPAAANGGEAQLHPATTHQSEGATDGRAADGVRRWRLPADWRLRPQPLPLLRLPMPSPALAERIEYSWVGQTARAIGTVVHAELQRLAQPGAPDDPSVQLVAGRYVDWLAELGVPAGERSAAAADVQRALQRVLADPRGRWLLDERAHREARSEVRLSGLYRGELVNISIDRMLVDASGVRWVIDYKTNRHEGGALEEFIEREVQRYRPQLQRYAALAGRLGTEPLRCALYFPLSGAFREVPIAD